MKIQTKLLVYILAALLLFFSTSIGIIIFTTKNMAVEEATNLAMAESREYAKIIENEIEKGFNILNILAKTDDIKKGRIDKSIVEDILEDDLFDNFWVDTEDDLFTEKRISEPYKDNQGNYISSLIVPLKEGNEVVGNVGIDINFEQLQRIIDSFDIFETGFGRLLSNKGIVVAHPNEDRRWDISGDFRGENEQLYREVVAEGKHFYDDAFSVALDDNVFKSFAPVNLGPTETPWSFGVVAPHEEMFAQITSLTKRIVVISVIAFILISIVILMVTKPLVNKIKEVKDYALVIADGDFSLNIADDLVQREDELGDLANAFKKIQNNLRTVIENISNVTENLASYSQQLSASAQEGNATIETTNNLTENMVSSIQDISASAEEVASFSNEANQEVQAGNKNINNTVSSIKEISNSIFEATEIIKNLDKNTDEIGEIIDLIKNIADQTNLLALNASIEAARAGEHGRGFTVVAEEIRQLAEETGVATERISDLINKTQNQSKKGLKAIKEVEAESKKGREIVEKTGDVFTGISNSIEEVSAQIEQTAYSTNDLVEYSDEINTATEDINSISTEITKSSQELAEMAQDLQVLVEQFKV